MTDLQSMIATVHSALETEESVDAANLYEILHEFCLDLGLGGSDPLFLPDLALLA